MNCYTELYSTYLQQNSLVQRAFRLQEIMTYPPSLSMTNEWEAINKLRVVGMQQAERGCRKFRTGAIAWSQTWQLIRDKIEVWALVRRHKEGKKVSSRFLRRKIKSSGIENANTATLAEACEELTSAHTEWKIHKQRAIMFRSSWIEELATARAMEGNNTVATEVKQLLQATRSSLDTPR